MNTQEYSRLKELRLVFKERKMEEVALVASNIPSGMIHDMPVDVQQVILELLTLVGKKQGAERAGVKMLPENDEVKMRYIGIIAAIEGQAEKVTEDMLDDFDIYIATMLEKNE